MRQTTWAATERDRIALIFAPGYVDHSECKTCFGHSSDAPLSLGNPRSESVCAVLGDEEMLTSFFEVLEPVDRTVASSAGNLVIKSGEPISRFSTLQELLE